MAKPKNPVKFISRYDTLTLVVTPKRTKVTDGLLEVIPGERITFENGVFETSDAKELKFLRAKIEAGNTDFTEVGNGEEENTEVEE